MDIRTYIVENLSKNMRIIEFGPLNRPVVNKNVFPNVFYADIKNTDEIKKLYTNNTYLQSTGIKVDIDTIVDVDIVVRKSYKKTFKNVEKFDVAILSHVIEHMPNILDFFQDIKNILNENGELIIIYPDRRYCFDHYRVDSSFKDAYMTYRYGLKENRRLIFDFCTNVLHENDPVFFWNNKNIVEKINSSSGEEIEKKYKSILKNRKYEDIHYWPFSDYGFLKFLYDAMRFNLMSFEIVDFIPTQENTQEFMVKLKLSNNNDRNIEVVKELINRFD